MVAVLLVMFVAAVAVLIGFLLGVWSSSKDRAAKEDALVGKLLAARLERDDARSERDLALARIAAITDLANVVVRPGLDLAGDTA